MLTVHKSIFQSEAIPTLSYPTAAAMTSQAFKLSLRMVIFIVTPCDLARRARTRTSCPPLYTPARRRVWEDLLPSTLSERSHGCIPMKPEICFTASETCKRERHGGLSEGKDFVYIPPHNHIPKHTHTLTPTHTNTTSHIHTWDVLHGAKSKSFLDLILIPNLIPRGRKVWLHHTLYMVCHHHIHILQLVEKEDTFCLS